MKTLKNLLRSITPVVLLTIILAGPVGCSRSETATIAAVEGRHATIETATGERETQGVAPTAQITSDGKRVKLPDLQSGDKSEEGSPEHSDDGAVLSDAQRAKKGELSIVPADEPRADVRYEGEISFVGEDLVRLRNFAAPVQLASELTFTVTDNTEILIFGKDAVIDDLQQGMTVTIVAKQQGEALVAKRIEAGPTLL